MNGDTPVNIAGVLAYPNDESGRMIRFIDSDYNILFHVPDGANIIVTGLDGTDTVLSCHYIDDTNAIIDKSIFHILQFAIFLEQRGAVCRPEHPKPNDICDIYEIYQLKNVWDSEYGFCSYEAAKGKLHPSHYAKVYAGQLAPKVTLDDLFVKHNAEMRPRRMAMRSMSVSDVVVLNRSGVKKAYYVDRFGFEEAKEFLNLPLKKRKRPGRER